MFAENLKKHRKKCGLTQNQVASTLNVSRSTYSYYELGKTFPDLSTLSKLVQLFGITYDELLDDEITKKRVVKLRDNPFVYAPESIGKVDKDGLQREERLLVSFFRLLPKEEKKKLISDVSEKLRNIYFDSV